MHSISKDTGKRVYVSDHLFVEAMDICPLLAHSLLTEIFIKGTFFVFLTKMSTLMRVNHIFIEIKV